MEARRVKKQATTRQPLCTHCSEAMAAPVEWHCPHGDWCSRCFYEHLQPRAKVERMLREEADRERRALEKLEHLQRFAEAEAMGPVTVAVLA